MKTIDKTWSHGFDFGKVLKCWNDNSNTYDLYRIAASHDPSRNYELDILHSYNDDEQAIWVSNYIFLDDLRKDLCKSYKHVVPVKATITIEDL